MTLKDFYIKHKLHLNVARKSSEKDLVGYCETCHRPFTSYSSYVMHLDSVVEEYDKLKRDASYWEAQYAEIKDKILNDEDVSGLLRNHPTHYDKEYEEKRKENA